MKVTTLPVVSGRFSPQLSERRGFVATALVTPYVFEYGSDRPATYALLMLPLYAGVGRVKNQAHWQTDVIACWVVGGVSGWAAHSLETPIMIQLLPHGAALGFAKQI
jgi:undecaprenyl-diphosphatase